MENDYLRHLWRLGITRMVENEFCSCLHHLIRHDENAEVCDVVGCSCKLFTPEPLPISVNREGLGAMADAIRTDFINLMVGLHQDPLGAAGMQDAHQAVLQIITRLRLLQTALSFELQSLAVEAVTIRQNTKAKK